MSSAEKTQSLTFEEALQRLETLVAAMEEGEIPLAELVAKFEEGDKLMKQCEKRLKEAELKIEKLKMKKNAPSFEAFEEEAE